MAKMSKNVRFKPKPEQIKFAEIYLDIDKKLTRGKIAADIGITDRTIRRWFKNRDFVDWLNKQAMAMIAESKLYILGPGKL